MIATTYLALACMIAIALAIRLRWPSLSTKSRRSLGLVMAVLFLPALLNLLSHWNTTNIHLNASLFWIYLFAYELCIVFFTFVRPRAVTSVIAVVLTFPLFFSSIVGPASQLFSTAQPALHSVGDGYFLELLPWSGGQGDNSGADFTVFYQPPGVRFFRRPFMGLRLYNTQCRTLETTATVNPGTGHIAVHCPPLSTDPTAPPSGTDLDYLIPTGARSPALARNLHR